jgi:hypothetical protein
MAIQSSTSNIRIEYCFGCISILMYISHRRLQIACQVTMLNNLIQWTLWHWWINFSCQIDTYTMNLAEWLKHRTKIMHNKLTCVENKYVYHSFKFLSITLRNTSERTRTNHTIVISISIKHEQYRVYATIICDRRYLLLNIIRIHAF